MRRRLVQAAAGGVLVLLTLAGCAGQKPGALHFRAVGYDSLPGWEADDQGAALAAFQRSCTRLTALSPSAPVGPYGTAADWRGACADAAGRDPADAAAARAFFEQRFAPLQVRAGRDPEGLFTGYYEPELKGSRQRDSNHPVPLLARPLDLISVDLGQFRPTLKGQRIAGRVSMEGRLVPYADRRQIEAEAAGAPTPLRQPLVWVDDPADAFFMEIQGSGRIRFADGSVTRLTFDGQNGYPYTPIGRVLAERGALPKEAVTMQAIRGWLAQNPAAAGEVMDQNASYIFFREAPIADPALGPPGAQNVALTPGRSLAVDLSVHGLGVPVFVAAEPGAPGGAPLQRLLVAQDTGGAIVGPVRGDVFWGAGPPAAAQAGAMKAKGEMFVLVPQSIAARLLNPAP
jgi:membrane-bound lytic murein transglycosylase A